MDNTDPAEKFSFPSPCLTALLPKPLLGKGELTKLPPTTGGGF